MHCLKFLQLVVFLVIAPNIVVGKNKKETFQTVIKYGMDCSKELGKKLTPSDIQQSLKKECPSSPDGKCIIGCTLGKMGVMKNGAFDEQGAKKMMDSAFKKESERVQKMAELKACLEKEPETTNDPCVSGPTMCACARTTGLM